MGKYDLIVEQYDQYRNQSTTDWILGLNTVSNELQPLTGKYILDYGCGTGRFSQYLAKQGAYVTGVDTSSGMIETARKLSNNNTSYSTIESGNLSKWKGNDFDIVIATFVFCTVSLRNEIVKIMKESFRVLKKNGVIKILNVNWERCQGREFISFKLFPQGDLVSGQEVKGVLKTDHSILIKDYFWSRTDYTLMLGEAGFTNIKVHEIKATSDSYPWIDEKEFSPFFIVSGFK